MTRLSATGFGYCRAVSDYNETGAAPVDDAAVPDPPTVDEVLERQADEFPEQARSAQHGRPPTPEELAAIEAGGDVVDDVDDTADDTASDLRIEGPNPA